MVVPGYGCPLYCVMQLPKLAGGYVRGSYGVHASCMVHSLLLHCKFGLHCWMNIIRLPGSADLVQDQSSKSDQPAVKPRHAEKPACLFVCFYIMILGLGFRV